jgi:uroporphyrinogen decarboxylase
MDTATSSATDIGAERPGTERVPLLLQAFTDQPLNRPAVWMMRQAGRYMHEYQAVRQKHSFLEICKTPEVAVEVTMQPITAFDFDASIIFSDILIPLEAMGLALEFTDAKGPKLPQPIQTEADLARLHSFDPSVETGFLLKALGMMRHELSGTNKALLGFAGAPWTLASYAMEGTSWKTGRHVKQWLYHRPDLLHLLLGQLSTMLIGYLSAQVHAGAQAVQLFDTWASQCPLPYYDEFVMAYQRQVITGFKAIHPTVPILLFVKQSAAVMDRLVPTGADGFSIDEWTPLDVARTRLGNGVTLQGNLDSAALFIEDDECLKAMTDKVIALGGKQRFIFNLGHGVLPHTPRENVRKVVEWVKASGSL